MDKIHRKRDRDVDNVRKQNQNITFDGQATSSSNSDRSLKTIKSNSFTKRHNHNAVRASGGDMTALKNEIKRLEKDNSPERISSTHSSFQSLDIQAGREEDPEPSDEISYKPSDEIFQANNLKCSNQSMKTARSEFSNMADGINIFNQKNNKHNANNKFNANANVKLKTELSKYKKELQEYTETTKELQEKYIKINQELNDIQNNHDKFLAKRKVATHNESENYTDSSSASSGSEFDLKRKFTQVFHRGNSFAKVLPEDENTSSEENFHALKGKYPSSNENELHCQKNKHISYSPFESCETIIPLKKSKRFSRNKENEVPNDMLFKKKPQRKTKSVAGLKDIYNVLKNVLDDNQEDKNCKALDYMQLQDTIARLKEEQEQFRTIIDEQQHCLTEYQARCTKAQQIMQTQQMEIDKLCSNNKQIEGEITAGIEKLRHKIDCKLKEVSALPHMMREGQFKYDKLGKENHMLMERMRSLQAEANQLKNKIEELNKRKTMAFNRLKAAERDLKIFKNYNTALKHEKRRLQDELQKAREQMENLQSNSKKSMARQRENTEKQRRDLQKRVFELELKLSRSQSSTSGLLQERDRLIAELQTQLNTLVHNFEVSQKHIRVLRRHIYSMSNGQTKNQVATGKILTETA